jgi:putative membrane protein
MRLILRLLINAAALWAAVKLVPGLAFEGSPLALLGVALVFGVLNAIVKPILKVLTCPMLILTLGLFTFVLNAIVLWMTAALSDALGLGFRAPLFFPAFFGALVISFVSLLLSWALPDESRQGPAER